MSEREIVTGAQAEIQALTELLRERTAERDQYKRERDEARAILARTHTSLNERVNDPVADR